MMTRMMNRYIIIIGVALLALSCDNGKGGKINEPYDGGPGIGIDTETVNKIQQYEDSIKEKEPEKESPKTVSSSSTSRRSYKEPDNMRGFDPASEDDMDDNGMTRYMEANDEESWD